MISYLVPEEGILGQVLGEPSMVLLDGMLYDRVLLVVVEYLRYHFDDRLQVRYTSLFELLRVFLSSLLVLLGTLLDKLLVLYHHQTAGQQLWLVEVLL